MRKIVWMFVTQLFQTTQPIWMKFVTEISVLTVLTRRLLLFVPETFAARKGWWTKPRGAPCYVIFHLYIGWYGIT